MGTPTAIIPVRGGELQSSDLEAIVEADGRTILIGQMVGSASGYCTGIAESVELVEDDAFSAIRWARALATQLRSSEFVVLPGSPDGRDLGAALAAELDWPYFAPAISANTDRVEVVAHAGMSVGIAHTQEPYVAVLQPGVVGVNAGSSETVLAKELVLEFPTGVPSVNVVEVIPPDAETIEIAEAQRIIGVGAGLLSGEDTEPLIDKVVSFGAKIGASMGATRVVTDAGFVSHDRQIGTTGVVVDPQLYINFAISGAVQHTAGLGHPDHIISVNTDPHCPMMSMANLAVVSDAVEVIKHLVGSVGTNEVLSND